MAQVFFFQVQNWYGNVAQQGSTSAMRFLNSHWDVELASNNWDLQFFEACFFIFFIFYFLSLLNNFNLNVTVTLK